MAASLRTYLVIGVELTDLQDALSALYGRPIFFLKSRFAEIWVSLSLVVATFSFCRRTGAPFFWRRLL